MSPNSEVAYFFAFTQEQTVDSVFFVIRFCSEGTVRVEKKHEKKLCKFLGEL